MRTTSRRWPWAVAYWAHPGPWHHDDFSPDQAIQRAARLRRFNGKNHACIQDRATYWKGCMGAREPPLYNVAAGGAVDVDANLLA